MQTLQVTTSIQSVIDTISSDNHEEIKVLIPPGVYRERVVVDKPFITLVGCGDLPEDVVISMDYYGLEAMDDGTPKRGTFRTYTMLVDSHDIKVENLTIENASGDSKTHGQALALYADGDNVYYSNVRLLGHQDTLFVGPLPPKEVEPGGFIGPKQFSPRIVGKHYFNNCYICGDVDFIFGGGSAYFNNCVIESLFRGEDQVVQGYVTAASTPEGESDGLVFTGCKLISRDCPEACVYLGRPWREFAKTKFVDCSFGPHIHPELWREWSGRIAAGNVKYIVENK